MANSVKIVRKKGTTIYCKTRDQKDAIGVEIAEAMRPKDDPKSYTQAEGRVALRFFNTGMPKETHIRMMLEPREAFDLYLKIQEVIRAKEKVELKITHRYMRGSEELLTSVIVEHWVSKEKSGFAIKASRKGGASHNVSMDRTHILYAGEILKGLSTAQAWSDVEVRTE
jgi:hypothetical protein